MSLLTSHTSLTLWQEVIKNAESRCSVELHNELEAYLIALLVRYTNKPELAKQILGINFLEAMQLRQRERNVHLQYVGDQCLIFAGFFPETAEKKHVKVKYFVDIGRAAYTAVSKTTNDLYASLSLQFVVLMDVLQSIRAYPELMPLQAYEQWHELGSQRAFKILQGYTKGIPLK